MPHDDLEDRIRRAYVRPVDEDVAARHLAAIGVATREAQPVRAPRRRRARLWRPVLATGLAVVALPAGLAVAGVDLPDAIDKPYDVVGVDLPNQTSGGDAPATTPVERATPERDDSTPLEPATTTQDETPGTRRSETRSKGRRGDEASDGKRQGGTRSSNAAAAEKSKPETPVRRSAERSHGQQGAAQKSSQAAEDARGNRVAGSKRQNEQKPAAKVRPSPPAARGPEPETEKEQTTPPGQERVKTTGQSGITEAP